MNTRNLDRIMTLVGAEIPDTPQAWAQVALACLDQGMVTGPVQDEVAATLRTRANIESEPDD